MNAETLFRETRLLFHALKHWVEARHFDLGLSASTRAVLERLLFDGAATVPDIARARGVSRQHVQQQVDALLEQGLVIKRDNPAHKRSSLIALTHKGRALIENMRADELAALSRLQVGVSDEAVSDAAEVLASWRKALREHGEGRAS